MTSPNALPSGQRRSLLHIICTTAREPMFLLLLAAGTRYLVFGELLESFTLFSAALVMLGLTLCFDLARRWHAYA